MTLEQMTEGYPKLATKVLVNKLRASESDEEVELITKVLAGRNMDINGNTLTAEPTVVEIEPETDEEIAEAEAEVNILDQDPATLVGDALVAYKKAKAKAEKAAKKQAIKDDKAAQKAELHADLKSEARIQNLAEIKAKKLAEREAKKAEALEKRIEKLLDKSPYGAPLLGKRIAFKQFKTGETIYGEVKSLVFDKRASMMLMHIAGDDGKVYHKVDTSLDVFLVGEPDEQGVPTLIKRDLPEDIKRRNVLSAEDIAEREAAKQAALEAKRESKMELSPYGAPLLGKRVGFKAFGSATPTYGKAVGLVNDKRANKVLIRIIGEDGKIYHKVDTSAELFEADVNGGLIERELPEPTVKTLKITTDPEVAPVSEEDASMM